MSTIVMGTSDIETNIQGHYDRNMLNRSLASWVHGRFGQVRSLPRNQGTRINFRRYESLAPATQPLTEGVTPTGKRASVTDIFATVQGYGDFITYSDMLDMMGLDRSLVEFSDILGEQMGDTIDIITRDELVTGTNVRYGGAVAARSSIITAVTTTDLDAVIRNLERSNVKKLRTILVGGSGIGTRPIAPAYVAVCHSDLRNDLESLTNWSKVEEYSTIKDALNDPENGLIEIGTYKNIRFVVSTNGKVWEAAGAAVSTSGLIAADSTNIEVYAILVFGANAYGTVPLQKGSIKNIVKKIGSSGSEDAINQRGTSGWKAYYTSKILNDNNMQRLEVGCTDL